ncbi:MAG: DUF4406 domain-containing protein [Dehalococcoidales bacterium]|nr:DUF4406 domain-containing protein [Dehalococcoidales bacterium]
MLVYIAGPYSSDPEPNTKNALAVAEKVLAAGMIPFVPHLSHYWHLLYEHDWETWLRIDAEVLLRCDAVLRIPGESKGADLEIETAKIKWIPVFYDIESLEKWAGG